MRTEDYHYYSELCLSFGGILIIIGVALPILTINSFYLKIWQLVGIEYAVPFLNQGIALVISGIFLIIFGDILSREYWAIRTKESKEKSQTLYLQRVCMYCGERISKNANFCYKCGKKQV